MDERDLDIILNNISEKIYQSFDRPDLLIIDHNLFQDLRLYLDKQKYHLLNFNHKSNNFDLFGIPVMMSRSVKTYKIYKEI